MGARQECGLLGEIASMVSDRNSKGTLEQSEGGVTKVERERAAMAALQDSLDAANETCRHLQRELALANKRYDPQPILRICGSCVLVEEMLHDPLAGSPTGVCAALTVCCSLPFADLVY